jgi:pyridoxine 4-dehydrogenase
LYDVLEAICEERGKTMSQVAINWCMAKGAIPIPGAKNLAQAEANLGALGWKLSEGEVLELEAAAKRAPKQMPQNVSSPSHCKLFTPFSISTTLICLC